MSHNPIMGFAKETYNLKEPTNRSHPMSSSSPSHYTCVYRSLFCVSRSLVDVYRFLLCVHWFLLCVYRSLLCVRWSLLCVYRSLLCVRWSLLCVFRSLECAYRSLVRVFCLKRILSPLTAQPHALTHTSTHVHART